MPTSRHVSLVQKLRWHVSGNISPTAFAIGDVEGHGDNAFVIGNLVGELFIFKGNHPEGLPWLTCKGLGTITAVTIGDIRNCGKNSIVVMSAEGLCHIFDVAGLDDEPGHLVSSGVAMSPAPSAGDRHIPSIYSSTPQHGSYQGSGQGHGHPFNPSIPATPSIRPVPDIHSYHHHHHSHSHHGTPPMPPPLQNTPHGSTSSSISGFHHLPHTPSNTPSHSHAGSIYGALGARRGSEAFLGSASITRTTAVLASLIGTSPASVTSPHGTGAPTTASTSVSASASVSAAASIHHPRSIGGNSAANSPTGTPLLKPQQMPSNATAPGPASRDHASRRSQSGTARNSILGKVQIREIGGRRVLDKPNLTLPVPVNINRAYIADIDGDGLNEIVLARTDRILHSYALQASKAVSPSNGTHPNSQHLNLVKLVSSTSSISTLGSSGLLSPSDDRRETVIHYPSFSAMGKHHSAGSTPITAGAGASHGNSDSQDTNCTADSPARLVLEEKKRWALDGQVHCLAVTKDINTGMPILLVAQPGLKFVMVDHTGNMSEPISQVQRNPRTPVDIIGPDTPTRAVGSGDVATDIICGTRYVDGEKKDVIGLMSMDGAIALHDLENSTVKIHDLDSSHKIFGFSKLNFGQECLEQRAARDRKGRRRNNERYTDDGTYGEGDNEGDDGDDDTDSDGDVAPEARGLDPPDVSNRRGGGSTRYTKCDKPNRARKSASSMLISDPFGSRFPKDDIFVGCSWSGLTFFIDQDFNKVQYDFEARVCAFGAGQYAITPGRNEPCLFYVDFEDNIFVYHNLYIQTEPSTRFQDIVNADTSLVRASQKITLKENTRPKAQHPEDPSTATNSTETVQHDLGNAPAPNVDDSVASTWTDHDMRNFVHSHLYNVNRYEDEFRRLKRLADIEIAKRAAFFEAEANKERAKQVGPLSSPEDTKDSLITKDVHLEPPQHFSSAGGSGELPSRGKSGHHGHFLGHDITTGLGPASPQYTRKQRDAVRQDDDDQAVSPLSPLSPVSMTTQASKKDPQMKRRSSLRIKDVLSHYEGKVTPPLKSPTSPSTHSSNPPKDQKDSSQLISGSSTTLTSIMKRFSQIKDLSGSSGRLARSLSTSSGSSGSGSASGSSQSTITQSHSLLNAPVLTKGKGHEARISKALRVNRPANNARTRAVGAARKLGMRSRLSQLQDQEDDSEEDDEQVPSEDGAGETDGDNTPEFDRSSRKSAGEDDFQQVQDYEADMMADEFCNRERCAEANEGEEDIVGVYTPSTISPIPSPGRLYSNQQGNVGEPSASLDNSAFTLARGLLSSSARPMSGGGASTSATTITGVMGRSSRHGDQDSHGARGHVRQRSGHGLLDVTLGQQSSREGTASGGVNSGPNSAGHSGTGEGRRSRAESILSTGSDIGGVIVPDITLMASSFPTQSTIPLSSEPFSQEELDQDSSESEDDINGASREESTEGQQRSGAVINPGARRPPRRSATLGSQDGSGHGAGSGSDTTATIANSQRHRRSGDGKSIDIKLMPAPLPRSNQHHQRQQAEQQKSWSTKDPPSSSSSHNSRSNSSGGGGDLNEGQRRGSEGFNRILGGKSPSTTSSATISEFGSGPSSPLTCNITIGNAILSNPSTNSYKGFSVLSLPMTSPSISTASAQQNQYFVASHYNPPLSASSVTSSKHDRTSAHEDDRMSIRSRASTYRAPDDNNDPSSAFAASSSSAATDHGIYGLAAASASTGTLVSDSLIRRLEEVQQQDRDLEEKQRQKEKVQSKDKGKEKAKAAQAPRPSALSRANSGASSISHHRGPSYSPTSYASTSASAHPSAPGSGPPSAPVSGPASGSGNASGSLGLPSDV